MATKKKAAAKKPDGRKNRSRVPGSVADRIDQLQIGDSYAESIRFDIESVDAGGIKTALTSKRSALAAYVARITEDLDARVFKVESGAFVTNDHEAIIANVTVTRVE